MNGLTVGCVSLGQGPNGSKEVNERLGVGASESHRVVSLGHGSDGTEEVSERMGLAKAVLLGCGSDSTEKVSERMGLARAVLLGQGSEGTEEVSEKMGLARAVSLGRGSVGAEEVRERLGVDVSERRRVVSLGRGSDDIEGVSESLGVGASESWRVGPVSNVGSLGKDGCWHSVPMNQKPRKCQKCSSFGHRGDQYKKSVPHLVESSESERSVLHDYGEDMAALTEKPLGDCLLGDLEEGEVETTMQEGKGSQGGEGAFTMVVRWKKICSPKSSQRPGMDVAVVDPIPSPLMMIEGMGD
ncbi:unnamed protein product [Citrullus colocynthis]|uniref:CCHC-type domain-containing protein n=1 Tax=Citrullus colocynthis TaxID=252529 RepID=A0ABP0YGD9_9ROSI